MMTTLPLAKRQTANLLVEDDAMTDYLSRWRETVEARRQQIEARQQGQTRREVKSGQMHNIHQSLIYTRHDDYGRPMRDPFLAHVAEKVYPRMTVLDVGAGTGRFTIPLARQACKLIATEPAPAMRQILEINCATAQLQNVSIIARPWPEALDDVGMGQADITICSHVLYPISNLQPFITALEQATRPGGLLFLYLWVGQRPDFTAELWQSLHSEPLHRQPDYLDAYNVLGQMGIAANVTVVDTWLRWRFDSFEDALADYKDRLCIHDDENAKLESLSSHLRNLIVEEDGALMVGKPTPSKSAIIWWQRG